MPNCTADLMNFGRLGRRMIEANFQGGAISSDGGLALLRQLDQRIGLSKAVSQVLHNPRDPDRITHSLRDLIAQRLYKFCCGYEDLNDHDRLRHDPLLQTAVGKAEVLVKQFIAAHAKAPTKLILDIDASDVPLHGDQELSEFHGYYDHYCYLPLYVFCGQAMLCCVLRRSRIDGAKQAAAVIKLLVKRLRQAWPKTHLIVRGDSGFCRQLLIRWYERHQVSYVIGVARNAPLQKVVAAWEAELEADYIKTQCKQRMIREFRYAAESWKTERRLVTRLEFGSQGRNPRFVVTNLALSAPALYDEAYCLRGEAENRIKEVQLDLFGTRASCHTFLANWLRLLLAALAYTLMQRLRTIALAGTALAHAQAATIRVKLLKFGASVIRNSRRIRILLASHHLERETFLIASRLWRLDAMACCSRHG